MAAVVERVARRHVAGGSAAGRAERGGSISAMAAEAAADAAGPDLPVGHFRARRGGFRNLDEDGYAIHRQLVAGARLGDHAAHHPARADGPRSELTGAGEEATALLLRGSA